MHADYFRSSEICRNETYPSGFPPNAMDIFQQLVSPPFPPFRAAEELFFVQNLLRGGGLVHFENNFETRL